MAKNQDSANKYRMLVFITGLFFGLVIGGTYGYMITENVLSYKHNQKEPDNSEVPNEFVDFEVLKDAEFPEELIQGHSGCGSDSMGQVINCRDKLYYRMLNDTEKLKEGRIYVYLTDHAIIHRLVKCLDRGCNKMIFKGDNNYVADKIVNRSQVKRELMMVEFFGSEEE